MAVNGATPVAHIAIGLDATAPGAVIEWAAAEGLARRAMLDVVAFGTEGCTNADEAARPNALLSYASHAELVVVGESADFSPARWLRICVPSLSSRRTACPIVVVRGTARQPLRRIVVGIDAGGDDDATLDWAADEAERHAAELVIVHGWQRETGAERSIRSDELTRSDADRVVALAVRHCRERGRREVKGDVIEGEPVAVLTASAGTADLLVIGSRGRSGYRTLVFGPVTLLMVERAPCPVAVIPRRFPRRAPSSPLPATAGDPS
jgi:nucleotide-binding universal stress UspA family protein